MQWMEYGITSDRLSIEDKISKNSDLAIACDWPAGAGWGKMAILEQITRIYPALPCCDYPNCPHKAPIERFPINNPPKAIPY